MKNNRRSIDGFVSPRRQSNIPKPDLDQTDDLLGQPATPHRSFVTTEQSESLPLDNEIKEDIDRSLHDIEIDQPDDVSPKKRWRKRKSTPKPGRIKRIFKYVAITLGILLALVAGYLGFKILSSSGQLFNGSILDVFRNQPLKQDEGGRSNVLLLGTTDDDPNHPGNGLTDTIMILSIDQTKKNAFMFSVPRDLYVDYERPCFAGNYGKINSYFSCINNGSTPELEQERMAAAREFIGNIFGLDLQYSVHVNSVVVRDLVNAVGGIDVDIEGSGGAPGILDRNFDWACNYTCYKVKYDNGVHSLDGEQAMFLAMARGNSSPTYGLGNSNFDREQNQQKIIRGIQAKALSSQTFTNLSKVTKLIDALGNNLRTNFATSEIKTLINLSQEIKVDSIHSLNLQDKENQLFDTPMINGQSVVSPLAGTFNYDEVRIFVKSIYADPTVNAEDAKIAIYNGSGVTGLAQDRSAILENLGFVVDLVDNAPDSQSYKTTKIYQLTDKKPATAKKLGKTFNLPVDTNPPFQPPAGIDFMVILGDDQVTTE